MTTSHFTTVPMKDVRYCPQTRDYEILVSGQVIGYAPTERRGAEIANEHIYLLLDRDHLDPADLSQEDADAILAAQIATLPLQPNQIAQMGIGSLGAQAGASEPRWLLPATHPIRQLIHEAAWLLDAPGFAA